MYLPISSCRGQEYRPQNIFRGISLNSHGVLHMKNNTKTIEATHANYRFYSILFNNLTKKLTMILLMRIMNKHVEKQDKNWF